MRVEQHGHAAALELQQQVAHDPAADRVECARRLVEHQQARRADQRLGDPQALLHPLRHGAHARARRVGQARPARAARAARPLRRPTRTAAGAGRAARRRAATRGSGTARPGSRSSARAAGEPAGSPATSASPPDGRTRPQAIFTSVDLPAPFGPSSPTSSPGWTSRSTPRQRLRAAVALGQLAAVEGGGHAPQCRKGACSCSTRCARNCRSIAQGARFVSIDLDACARAARGRSRRDAGAGRTRPPAPARRDQLRLRLVPDAAQAARAVGLPHDRRRVRGARAVDQRRAARGSTPRAVAAALGQEPAHPLMRLYAPGAARPGPLPRRPLGARPGRAGGRVGGAAGDAAGPRHALLRRPRLLQARADRPERPRARRVGGVPRPRSAHDLRRQPRPARAARGRRAALRPRPRRPHRRGRAAAPGGGGA